MHSYRARPLVIVAVLLALAGSSADAETVQVEASTRYERNRFHEFTLGGGYRALWKAPIEIPVLDFATEGGGLTPTRRFGGNQTPVLAFQGRDGRSYTFRSTDKDPSVVLHPDLQQTFVKDVVQDQMAAQHPAAPIIADRITAAAGVLTQQERLVVMPDDPALGEFREQFAGMIGTFYEFPMPVSKMNPGFHGATEILDHKAMYERLAKSPNDRVDALAFLRARLVDIMLGDFDRHRKQWRWARLPGNELWQPLPEDRDMAFVRYEGVAVRVAHVYIPTSDTESGDRLIDELDPYGAGDFNSIGATVRLQYDTRTSVEGRASELELGLHENSAAGYPLRGTLLELRGLVSPEVWDVRDTWGSMRASAAGYATVGEQDRFTFAARGGGEAASTPTNGTGASVGGCGSHRWCVPTRSA